jgi:hypothetical protein
LPKILLKSEAFLNLPLTFCGFNQWILKPLLQLLGWSVHYFQGSSSLRKPEVWIWKLKGSARLVIIIHWTSFFKTFEPFIGLQTTGIIAASFPQHALDLCSCFLYFEIEFNINSLFFHRFHTKRDKATPQSLSWL